MTHCANNGACLAVPFSSIFTPKFNSTAHCKYCVKVVTGSPRNSLLNQLPASKSVIAEKSRSATTPCPFVVRSKVSSLLILLLRTKQPAYFLEHATMHHGARSIEVISSHPWIHVPI